MPVPMQNERLLGVGLKDKEILLYSLRQSKAGSSIIVKFSHDARAFSTYNRKLKFLGEARVKRELKDITNLWISQLPYTHFMLFTKANGNCTKAISAFSTDLFEWFLLDELPFALDSGMVIPEYTYKDTFALLYGDNAIRVAYSSDVKKWHQQQQSLLDSRQNAFDSGPLSLVTVIHSNQHILLVYTSKTQGGSAIGIALLDKDNLFHVVFRSERSLCNLDKTVRLVGAVVFEHKLCLYVETANETLKTIVCDLPFSVLDTLRKPDRIRLRRFEKNPIIHPRSEHAWESKATFNTAALYDSDKVHFLYRAIGDSDVSVLGYAASSDGLHIDERSNNPVYTPKQPFETPLGILATSYSHYASGGGYGGVEDPRLTKIDDRIYMTYVAYDGWSPPRVAITSIDTLDFRNKDWQWSQAKLISPPNIVDKNACILSEKINGKYVVFHRVFPNILIDFVDDLEFNDYLKGEYLITPREDSWDSLKVGVGAPPVKTKDGWLVIYQAVGSQDYGRYKIGAMLLDIQDPTKVICRSRAPIIEPIERYENDGYKSGVVYPCGAVVMNQMLHVYYGGADTVVCVASSNLDTFLSELKASHSIHMQQSLFN